MKFRAVPNTELVVSEAALALDAPTPSDEPVSGERMFRLAYDEGINLFLIPGEAHPFDPAFASSFTGDRRQRILLALRLAWNGYDAGFSARLEQRLSSLGTDRADILLLDGVSPDDLHAGAVGDAVHRLRAAGTVGHAGLQAGAFARPDDARLIERNGFNLIDDDFARLLTGEERRIPALIEPPRVEALGALSFLWTGTGRTPAQAAVQFALACPGVCAAVIRPSSPAALKELARAPLAPPLLDEELAAARAAFARAGAGQPVGA